MRLGYASKEEFKNAIVKFELGEKNVEMYMQFLIAVKRVFNQGLGLSGKQISDAVEEALEELRGYDTLTIAVIDKHIQLLEDKLIAGNLDVDRVESIMEELKDLRRDRKAKVEGKIL